MPANPGTRVTEIAGLVDYRTYNSQLTKIY